MYDSILVPLDGSIFSEHALPVALSIAAHTGAMLHVVHIHVPIKPAHRHEAMITDDELNMEFKQYELHYLEDLRARLTAGSESGRKVTYQLLDGPITESLMAYADAHHVNLTVMTTHGRGGVVRTWLGSVADTLVRHAEMPVLLLRPHEAKPDFDRKYQFKNILIPLDLSHDSAMMKQILNKAIALGKLTEAEYTLLHAVSIPFLVGGELVDPRPPDFDITLVDAVRHMAEHQLDRVAAELSAKEGVKVRVSVITKPQAAVAILDETRAQEFDLIAMATHGRSDIGRLLLGSVADKVLRGADVPILLYRPQELAAPAREISQVTVAQHDEY